jgi:hypothetical protein
MKKPVIIGIVLLLAAGTFVVVQLRQKPQRKPEIAVRFLSMTNNSSGAVVARFELRNNGSVPTDVTVPGFIDMGMRGGGYFGFSNVTLQPRATLETRVEAPLTSNQWRAEFLCSIPLNLMQKFKNTLAGHGFPVMLVVPDVTHVYSEYLPPNPQGGDDWQQFGADTNRTSAPAAAGLGR